MSEELEQQNNAAPGIPGTPNEQPLAAPTPEQPQAQERTYSAVELLGQPFSGTRAGEFGSIEELGNAYNNIMGALENRVEELTDDQKMALLSSLKIEVPQMSQTSQAPAEYSFRSEYEDIDSVVKETARHLNLSEEQAAGLSQAITSVAESAFASVGEELQAVAQQYVEDSRQVFGDKLNEVVTNADYACDKIIPNLCKMDGEAFRDLLGSHGLAGHPAILSLLNHVTALYGQGRGPAMGHSIPSSTYGSRGEVSPESFRTPEAYKILADKTHPQHEELKRQIIDHSFRRR